MSSELSNKRLCEHCLSEVNPETAIIDWIGDQEHVFCCTGCDAIYRLIHEQGLDEFYSKRIGWWPGRPEIKEFKAEEFDDYIRELSPDERELEFIVLGIRCASCIWLIEHLLKKMQGMIDIRVNYATHRARLRWRPEQIGLGEILQKIASLGYIPKPYIETELTKELIREKRDLLVRFGTASFFSMQLMLYTIALYAGYFQGIDESLRRLFHVIAWVLATPVMFYCGYPFIRNAINGFKNRTFNMDVLIFLGSFSAYAYSVAIVILISFLKIPLNTEVYFDTSSMIITLILLGRFIEQGARIKATSSLQALLSLQPRQARILRDSEEELIPLNKLSKGDLIVVRPGERIPVDGIIIEGGSEIDEQMLTGESMPVYRDVGSQVFAGTLNLNGRLIVKVESIKETVLSRITQAVLDTQAKRARIQGIADRVVGIFVPAIITISLFTFLYWYVRENTGIALMNSVSVLVIACPCALGLATPLAILIGSTNLYLKGIIIKDGNIIEDLAKADTILFDKTGTLTEGRPSLIDIIAYEDSKERLHIIAASLEQASEHIVSKAITNNIKRDLLLPLKEFKAIPGLGIKGNVECPQGDIKGKEIIIGNLRFINNEGILLNERQISDYREYSKRGYTLVGISVERRLKAWFVIADRLSPEAKEVIERLKVMQMKIIMLTGDQRTVAEEISKELGVEEFYSEVLPIEKAEIIRNLKDSGKKVIMVGDGINDAPALSEAHAGIATGGAADITAESAGAVMMRKDLRLVIELLHQSKKILSIIKQNLFWAFSYNIIAIPLAVSGKIHPIISAISMAVSSLIVLGNSLRLRRD